MKKQSVSLISSTKVKVTCEDGVQTLQTRKTRPSWQTKRNMLHGNIGDFELSDVVMDCFKSYD